MNCVNISSLKKIASIFTRIWLPEAIYTCSHVVMFLFQEIEPRCGEALCKLFPSDDNVDLNEIVREARRSKRPDFRFSSRGRESFRGRGDFRLGLLFEIYKMCGRNVT